MLKLAAIGRLGKDAIVNKVNGKNVINFSVGVTEKRRGEDKTTWIECGYWSDSSVGDYLVKGAQVYVEGNPEIRTYEKNDGSTGSSLSLFVREVKLLGSGKSNGNNNSKATAAAATDSDGDNNDLPF